MNYREELQNAINVVEFLTMAFKMDVDNRIRQNNYSPNTISVLQGNVQMFENYVERMKKVI